MAAELSTVFALIALFAAAAAVYGAWRAATYADRAIHAANALQASRGVLTGHTHSLEALDRRMKSLQGYVYREKRRDEAVIEGELLPENDPKLTTEQKNAAIRARLRAQNGMLGPDDPNLR